MTILEALKLATDYLEKYNVENARLNAELLLSDVLNCKRLELYTNFDKPLNESEIHKYREYLKRRTIGEPVQYIIGKANFYGMEFIVTPDVLIPRPETELLVEEVLNGYDHNSQLKILDICSGSGNIGITLAKYFINSIIHCIDISEKAIEIGRLNAQQLNVKNVQFHRIDILTQTPVEKNYDLIVSNPPYISESKKQSLQKEIKFYEPHVALFVDDELKFYKRIIELSDEFLIDNGRLVFEIDHEQAMNIQNLMVIKKFTDIKVKKDYADLNRIISGVKS